MENDSELSARRLFHTGIVLGNLYAPSNFLPVATILIVVPYSYSYSYCCVF